MFEQFLIDQNTHWSGVLYEQGIQRDCMSKIVDYLKLPHIISITGVRRAGKSKLLKQTINFLMKSEGVPLRNILSLNLEHPYLTQFSQDVMNLERLFDDYLKIADPKGTVYCFLDEVQAFKDWPVFVKAHYEQKGVKFIITGSNSFLMSSELLTLLSGRTLPVEVFPLSFKELAMAKLGLKKTDPIVLGQHRQELRRLFDTFLRYGGFPEPALLEDKRFVDDILNAYSKTILYQDVATRLKVKKPEDLERLFYYMISHVGTPFSHGSLTKVFDLSDKTIKEYIEALIDAYLLFEIDPFSPSMKAQIRGSKKVYAIDTGMVNATAFQFSQNRGRLFENITFLELKRRQKELYSYKTADGYEVDFVAHNKGTLELFQACVELDDRDAVAREGRALAAAAKELKVKRGIVLTTDDAREWSEDGVEIEAVPLYRFVWR